jgi:hypothetical protein
MTPEYEQEALNKLTAWTLSLRDGAFIHQHVVDAWAAQHADEDAKPIRVAFALIGLYLHIEKGFTGRQVQLAHVKLAQPHGRGRPRKEWPQFTLPKKRGTITVVDVMAAPEDGRAAAVDRWCESVWEAWRESHDQVRRWADNEEI